MKTKVGLIGYGNIGAHACLMHKLESMGCEVVVINDNEQLPKLIKETALPEIVQLEFPKEKKQGKSKYHK